MNTAHAVAALRRAARAEWGPLHEKVRHDLVRKRPRVLGAIPMTLAAVCLTGLLQVVQNQPWGYQPVQNLGSVQASQPWWLALLRTPLSVFVPALDLPVWGALAQIFLVFGVCEICLGRLRTLLVAYLATLAGTMYARYGTAVGPDAFLGLPAKDALVHDAGPSAAVVGLAVYVAWRYRAWFTAFAVTAAMTVEMALKPNLAGREHLAAIAAALLLCAAETAYGVRRARRVRGQGLARGRERARGQEEEDEEEDEDEGKDGAPATRSSKRRR
ncbi:hypothetical protein AB0C51_25375 [Streptomyces pathocidini]|uniref:hypothetical protein n=1 Tax=Streptomyces pathocidini TaxID=1650571 RepID=UPI0033C1177F